MPKRLHAIVSGRVQGVGFRYFVRQVANELELSGWVRNLPDRTVETVVEGPDDIVEEFRQRIWKGPGLSRVDDVKEEFLAPTSEDKGFNVRY